MPHDKDTQLTTATFDGLLTALEVAAQRGDASLIRRRIESIRRSFSRVQSECAGLKKRLTEQANQTRRWAAQAGMMQEVLKKTADDYQSTFSTFDKFRTLFTIIQQARTLPELPPTFEVVRRNLKLDGLRLVLTEEFCGNVASGAIPTCPQKSLTGELDRAFRPCQSRQAYIGRTSLLPELPLLLGEYSNGSCYVYPLRNKYEPETIIGAISFFSNDPTRYSSSKATDFLDHFCHLTACTVVSLSEHDRLMLESTTDKLTGACNRNYLDIHGPNLLNFAGRRELPVCVLFIDLDNFKPVNDQLGHEAGDSLLREMACRIRDSIRPYDIFIRLGGDEFVIVTPDTGLDQAEGMALRIREDIAAIDVATCTGTPTGLTVSATVGIAAHAPGQSLDDVIAAADADMYARKREGKRQASGDRAN